MAALTLRILTNAGDTTKGSALTNAEMDQNLIDLNNELDTKAPIASPTFTGTASGTFSGTFSGTGSGLTTLNASELSSGTIPGDRGVTAGSASPSFIEYAGTTKTAGQFDGGTTAPTNVTRLNYDGYLYATRFYGDGSQLTGTAASLTAGSVTNGVYTSGDQSISGIKTFADARFTDANYRAYVSATNAIMLMDTNDYIQYDRTNNIFYLAVGSALKFSLDGSGNLGTISKIAVGTTQATNTAVDFNGTQVSNIVAVGALNIDCSLGNYFTKTINGASTFTVSNVPASRAFGFTLELTHTSGAVTWFAGVEWPNGSAPTLTTGKTHLFMFVTDDGGTRWRASSLINYTN